MTYFNPAAHQFIVDSNAAQQKGLQLRNGLAEAAARKKHGAGIVAGDADALAAWGEINPAQALSMSQAHDANRRANESHGWAGERHTSAQLEAMRKRQRDDVAEFFEGANILARAQSPEHWETMINVLEKRGFDDLGDYRGQFEALGPVFQRFGAMDQKTQTEVQWMISQLPEEEREDAIRRILVQKGGGEPGGSAKPTSTVGKIMADYNNGLISLEQRDAALAKANGQFGTQVQVGADGSVSMNQGYGLNGGNPGTATASPKKRSEVISSADQALINGADAEAKIGRETLQRLEVMVDDIDNIGWLGPGGRAYNAIDQAFGDFLPGDAAAASRFSSVALEEAMKRIQQTKGAVTEREMSLFIDASPDLGKNKAANLAIIEQAKIVSQRAVERQKFLRKYRETYGQLDAGAFQLWDEFVSANPVLQVSRRGRVTVNPGNVSNWGSLIPAANAATPQGSIGEPPQGITPQEWDALTPDERQLWSQ